MMKMKKIAMTINFKLFRKKVSKRVTMKKRSKRVTMKKRSNIVTSTMLLIFAHQVRNM